MIADNEMQHTTDACRVEVSAGAVDAGAGLGLKGKVRCLAAGDLRGTPLRIQDQDGALVKSVSLREFDGETNETPEFVVDAPLAPGVHTWLAVCAAHETRDARHEESSSPFSFTVRPHTTRVVVWDVPPAVEGGETVKVKFGVKCSSECRPEGWVLQVRDHDGNGVARTTLSGEVWPDTAALYHTEVSLTAPGKEGLYAWEATAPASGLEVPHAEGRVRFGVRVVSPPECILTIEAIDKETQAPIKGAKVVVHPYRTFTDERGMATLRVPKGDYRLFVSGGNYFPFRRDGEVSVDTTIRAELGLDVGPSDAEIWS